MNFQKKLSGIFKTIYKQVGLISYWILLILFVLIALPAITTNLSSPFAYKPDYSVIYDGLDIADITSGKIPLEFKFKPTLDFYPGSKQVFAVSDTKGASDERVVNNIDQRLKNIGLSNYQLYGRRSGNSDLEVVLESNLTSADLTLLSQLMQSSGNLEFSKQIPVPKNTSDTNSATPQYYPASFKLEDVEAIDLTYGSDIGGYGLNISFKDSVRDQLLVGAVSDVNPDQGSQLLLTINGQVVAAQRYALNSNQTRPTMVFATYFGNDQLATMYLRDMMIKPELNYSLRATNNFPINGTYERYIPFLKIILALAIILSLGLLIWKHKGYGLFSWLNLIFMFFGTLALTKLFILPISTAAVIGFIAALGLYVLATRELLSLNPFSRATELKIDHDYFTNLKQVRQSMLYFIIAASAVLIVINYFNFPALIEAGQYFIAGAAITYLSLLLSIPATTNLIES
jgi:hypothetical protein